MVKNNLHVGVFFCAKSAQFVWFCLLLYGQFVL